LSNIAGPKGGKHSKAWRRQRKGDDGWERRENAGKGLPGEGWKLPPGGVQGNIGPKARRKKRKKRFLLGEHKSSARVGEPM